MIQLWGNLKKELDQRENKIRHIDSLIRTNDDFINMFPNNVEIKSQYTEEISDELKKFERHIRNSPTNIDQNIPSSLMKACIYCTLIDIIYSVIPSKNQISNSERFESLMTETKIREFEQSDIFRKYRRRVFSGLNQDSLFQTMDFYMNACGLETYKQFCLFFVSNLNTSSIKLERNKLNKIVKINLSQIRSDTVDVLRMLIQYVRVVEDKTKLDSTDFQNSSNAEKNIVGIYSMIKSEVRIILMNFKGETDVDDRILGDNFSHLQNEIKRMIKMNNNFIAKKIKILYQIVEENWYQENPNYKDIEQEEDSKKIEEREKIEAVIQKISRKPQNIWNWDEHVIVHEGRSRLIVLKRELSKTGFLRWKPEYKKFGEFL